MNDDMFSNPLCSNVLTFS